MGQNPQAPAVPTSAVSKRPGPARYFVPAALGFCLSFSIVLAIVKPIPHGHRYELGVLLYASLAAIWFLYAVRPEWVFRKSLLTVVLVIGVAFGALGLARMDPHPEIVPVYDSVFQAFENGQNPYTSGTIFHWAEFRKVVYGNFNYPPMEIYPYYAVWLIAGRWNLAVLTVTILLIQAIACFVLVRTFPKIKLAYLWPFFPLFVCGEFRTNSAMTFLMAALILWAIKKERDRPGKGLRYLVAVLFGIGLTTKFLIIPFFAAYYWNKFDRKRLRSLLDIAVEAGIGLGTALLIIAPYGVKAVVKSTILFNLILKDRATQTTFFPNVLSGSLSWAGLSGIYPYVALALFGAAILVAPRLNVFSAMLASTFVFLFVAPTPRSQFLSTVIYLAVAGIYMNAERQGTVPAEVWKPGSA
jgi:hypothetical protein